MGEIPMTVDSADVTVVGLPAPCAARSFDRFSDALKEVIGVRVWSGIHFRTADVQGAVLGKKVARYMNKHYFGPAS